MNAIVSCCRRHKRTAGREIPPVSERVCRDESAFIIGEENVGRRTKLPTTEAKEDSAAANPKPEEPGSGQEDVHERVDDALRLIARHGEERTTFKAVIPVLSGMWKKSAVNGHEETSA